MDIVFVEREYPDEPMGEMLMKTSLEVQHARRQDQPILLVINDESLGSWVASDPSTLANMFGLANFLSFPFYDAGIEWFEENKNELNFCLCVTLGNEGLKGEAAVSTIH